MLLRFEPITSRRFPDHELLAYDDAQGGIYVGRIGFDLTPGTRRIGEIYGFSVEPDYRGPGGAAKAILKKAEAGLIEMGFKRAGLSVAGSNRHAQAFYERCGWKRLTRPTDTSFLYYWKVLGR